MGQSYLQAPVQPINKNTNQINSFLKSEFLTDN